VTAFGGVGGKGGRCRITHVHRDPVAASLRRFSSAAAVSAEKAAPSTSLQRRSCRSPAIRRYYPIDATGRLVDVFRV
jgi:hypothetical protein